MSKSTVKKKTSAAQKKPAAIQKKPAAIPQPEIVIGGCPKTAVYVIASICLIVILLIVLISSVDHPYKKEFLLPNVLSLLLGLACVLLVWRLAEIQKLQRFFNIIAATAVLLAIEIVIMWNIFFVTGWEVITVLDQAITIALKDTDSLWHSYFSWYPNNIFITWFFSLFFHTVQTTQDVYNSIFAIVVLQCILSAAGGWVLYDAVKELSGKKSAAITAWFAYAALSGLSPWLVVTYSDALGLAFPIFIFRLYQTMKDKKRIALKWALLVLLSYWGYRIKPQVVIVFIAIVIIELLQLAFASEKKAVLMRLLKGALIALGCFGASMALFAGIVSSTGLKISKEASFGPLHMVMMGLNPETHGGYYEPDVVSTSQGRTRAEKREIQLETISQRLSDYGFAGLADHLYQKTLVIFNDGSFAWGLEGDFYPEDTMPEDVNSTLCPFLKSVFYSNGTNYRKLLTFEQAIWLACLLLCACSCVLSRSGNKANLVLTLSLIGIILFEMIFEARARYLFTYSPLFIAEALLGLQAAWLAIARLMRRRTQEAQAEEAPELREESSQTPAAEAAEQEKNRNEQENKKTRR